MAHTASSSTKKLRVLCASLAAALLAILIWQTISYALLNLHVIFAEEQTDIFSAMREKAAGGDAKAAAGALEYVVSYYPSGTKQTLGSKLDRIIERARASAISDIIADLRVKTGDNLGDDPRPWIEKYGAQSTATGNRSLPAPMP